MKALACTPQMPHSPASARGRTPAHHSADRCLPVLTRGTNKLLHPTMQPAPRAHVPQLLPAGPAPQLLQGCLQAWVCPRTCCRGGPPGCSSSSPRPSRASAARSKSRAGLQATLGEGGTSVAREAGGSQGWPAAAAARRSCAKRHSLGRCLKKGGGGLQREQGRHRRPPRQHAIPACEQQHGTHPCPADSRSPRRPRAPGGTVPACLRGWEGGAQGLVAGTGSSSDVLAVGQQAMHRATQKQQPPRSAGTGALSPDTSSAMVMASGSRSWISSLASMR